jgi:uncharacterized protein
MKRKYGNHPTWKRVIEREYAEIYLETPVFKGYITLLHAIKVAAPLKVRYGDSERSIVDDGYMWLQHFPLGQNFGLLTVFDQNGSIIQWYIDICHGIGTENGVPWLDDLYLDIVVLPTDELILLDEDELQEALENDTITKEQFDLAWLECERIKRLIEQNEFILFDLSKEHKELLEKELK